MKATTSGTMVTLKNNLIMLGHNGSDREIILLARIVKRDPSKVYEILEDFDIETDSIVRESLFELIADVYYDGDYRTVYNQWLED